MLSIRQVAMELDVSRATVYALIRRGQLHPRRNPALLKGGQRIPRSQVDAIKHRDD